MHGRKDKGKETRNERRKGKKQGNYEERKQISTY